MKTFKLLLSAFIVAAALHTTPVFAEEAPAYWIVETNEKTKDYTIVRFYSGCNELFYEEKLDGVYLKFERKKVQRQLNEALAKAQQNQLASQNVAYNRNLVAIALHK
jgi:hypothetical protein